MGPLEISLVIYFSILLLLILGASLYFYYSTSTLAVKVRSVLMGVKEQGKTAWMGSSSTSSSESTSLLPSSTPPATNKLWFRVNEEVKVVQEKAKAKGNSPPLPSHVSSFSGT